jgi:hypothetical protein
MAFKSRIQDDHRKPESVETAVAVYPHRFSSLIFLFASHLIDMFDYFVLLLVHDLIIINY